MLPKSRLINLHSFRGTHLMYAFVYTPLHGSVRFNKKWRLQSEGASAVSGIC